MQRETLSGGGWVDIRDRDEITQRGRRGMLAIASSLGDVADRLTTVDETSANPMAGFSEEQIDAVLRYQEATVVALVAGWSRSEPLPTLATVGDLPTGLYDELVKLTARRGAEALATLDTSVGDGTPDPKDLSGSSDPSNGLSKDDSEPTGELIPMLPSGGAVSATGG